MVTSTPRRRATSNPLVWALAIVMVMVAGGYTYAVVARCQTSTFEAIKIMSISLGQCDAATPPAKDKVPLPQPAVPAQPVKVTRSDMPCRWAWIYLGKYSPAKGEYVFPPAFRFSDARGPSSPFPKLGDKIILTTEKTLLVTGYGNSPAESKCDQILSPPWGYTPKTSRQYEAGSLKKDMEVAVNDITLMPEATTEPTYVWALIGAEQ